MQQGSNLATQQHLNVVSISQAKQAVLFQAVVEVNALCLGIQSISQLCINESHVTLDQIGEIGTLATLMRKKLTALGLDVAAC